MPEPRNDPRNDFPVAMLTDQHMRTSASVAEQHHQLLRVPEGKNDVASISIQRINLFMPTRFITHGARNAPNNDGGNRRQ